MKTCRICWKSYNIEAHSRVTCAKQLREIQEKAWEREQQLDAIRRKFKVISKRALVLQSKESKAVASEPIKAAKSTPNKGSFQGPQPVRKSNKKKIRILPIGKQWHQRKTNQTKIKVPRK